MGPTVFFYPRGLLALVWLVLMRHAMWSSERSVACRPLPPPITPPRPRSHEPQAFAGLTSKPHGAACEQEATPPTAPPAVPPDPMPVSHRRPRRLDTAMPFCPHATCEYRGGVGLGHLRAKGPPNSAPWRPLPCPACGGYVVETPRTISHGQRVPVELLVRAIACVAEGVGLRGPARVFAVDPNPGLQGLVEAADPLQAVSRSFWHD